ncbi:conserved hypothetical protein [Flavobacterium sp. 9AF]|uniref:hypothetical protein n=1 Tax=Flavobacterium sp. 9AF TaxID=2653142 RepID=UPI0012F1F5BA|nr:hypothetical protein [Flavobacterium sp. 9AF]VXC17253.1 conserved hypothetical protein [Flavobacterium sp. 9AF]
MYKYFVLFIVTFSFGQVPYSKYNPKNTLSVKGIGYINIFQPRLGAIIGVEKGFFKNHSLGLKFINSYYFPRQENVEDRYGIIHDLGNYENHKNQSFIFEYKYYFDFNEISYVRVQTGISFYISLNYKIGKKTIEKDRDYEHDFYFQNIDYTYIGPAIGAVLSNSSSWSFDVQIGYLTGKKNQTTYYEVPDQYILNEKYPTNYFRFEFLIAYNFDF